MSGKIRVTEGGRDSIVEITEEPITIGRDPASRIVVGDRLASRNHGRFCWVEGAYVYEDLSSSNGSFVSGERVQRHELKSGDAVTVGEARFHVELAGAAPDDTPVEEVAPPQQQPQVEPDGPRLSYLHQDGRHWIAAKGRIVIGRAPECDIVIDDPRVSSRHATLMEHKGRWLVADMGSGNGIVVGNKKVKKLELAGDVEFRIGTVKFQAHDFPVRETPSAAPESSTSSASRVAAPEMAMGRTRHVEVGNEGSQALFTVSFIAVLGVVLYFGFGLLEDFASDPAMAIAEGDRLAGDGYFEQLEVGVLDTELWQTGSTDDNLEIETGDDAPQGRKWLLARGVPDSRGVFRVEYGRVFEVAQEKGLRITARLKNSGFDRVGLCVRWITPSTDGDRLIQEDFSTLKSSSGWLSFAGEFSTPEGNRGTSARISLVAFGKNAAALAVDQLVVRSVGMGVEPSYRVIAGSDEQEISLAIDDTGVAAVHRGRMRLLSDLRIALGTPRPMAWGQLLPSRKEQVVIGDDGAVRLGFELKEESENVVLQQFARAIGWRIAASWFPQRPAPLLLVGNLPEKSLDSPVQVFSGDSTTSSSDRLRDLQRCSGTEITIGKGKEQLVLSFRNPVHFSVIANVDGPGAQLCADAGVVLAGSALDLSIAASSEREEGRVLAILEKIDSLLAIPDEGAAQNMIKDARKAFPWREDLERKLVARESLIQIEVDAAFAQIEAVVADAEKYPGAPTGRYLKRICEAAVIRFKDLEPGVISREILSSMEQQIAAARGVEEEDEIERLLARGRSALGRDRHEVAKLYFQWVVDHHPSTPGADTAQQELKLIEARGN